MMTPGRFDAITAREMIGDERARVLELAAREDAELGEAKERIANYGATYFAECQKEFERVIYRNAFETRMKRIARLKGADHGILV